MIEQKGSLQKLLGLKPPLLESSEGFNETPALRSGPEIFSHTPRPNPDPRFCRRIISSSTAQTNQSLNPAPKP